jgi:multisubunit Na+/H+ antiporter MnhB subunit
LADLVQFALGLIGTIFLILIIVSGYQWMMAGGNKDTITKARDRMTSAVIGLVIVLAAYLITNFVLDTILNL